MGREEWEEDEASRSGGFGMMYLCIHFVLAALSRNHTAPFSRRSKASFLPTLEAYSRCGRFC